MAEYLIYFNQQWVGDHTEEWFRGRGPLAFTGAAALPLLAASGLLVLVGTAALAASRIIRRMVAMHLQRWLRCSEPR